MFQRLLTVDIRFVLTKMFFRFKKLCAACKGSLLLKNNPEQKSQLNVFNLSWIRCWCSMRPFWETYKSSQMLHWSFSGPWFSDWTFDEPTNFVMTIVMKFLPQPFLVSPAPSCFTLTSFFCWAFYWSFASGLGRWAFRSVFFIGIRLDSDPLLMFL